MKMKGFAVSLLALSLGLAGVPAVHALQGPPPPPNRYGPPPPLAPGWDTVPGSYASAVERRAYQEGIHGARKDRENGRVPNVNNRDEFRRPDFNVPPPMYRAYRRAFRAGYNRGVQMFYSGRRY